MTATDKQEALIARYAIIPDIQERLMAATRHRGQVTELDEDLREDSLLVPGCQSRVWLLVGQSDGLITASLAADSPLVRGLAALVCDVFAGTPATSDLSRTTTTIIARLGFERLLTPTRLNGLANVEATLKARATDLAR